VKPIAYMPFKSSGFRFKSSKFLTEYNGDSGFFLSISTLASDSSNRERSNFLSKEASAEAVSFLFI
jgi:hypothetical protein